MKRIIRTVPGKVALFISTIILLSVTALSIAGAVIFYRFEFYTNTSEQMEYQLYEEKLIGEAYGIIEMVRDSGLEGSYVGDDRDTNLRYIIYNMEEDLVARSENYHSQDKSSGWEYYVYFGVKKSPVQDEFMTFLGAEPENRSNQYRSQWEKEGYEVYSFCAYIDRKLSVTDYYSVISRLVHIGYSLRYGVYPIGILSFLLAVLCFVTLLCAAARRPGTEELHPGALNRVPLEVMLAGILGGGTLSVAALFNLLYSGIGALIGSAVIFLVIANLFLGLSMSIAARIKQRTLLTNTLIWRCVRFLKKIICGTGRGMAAVGRQLPVLWKTALVFAGISFVELIFILGFQYNVGMYLLFWFIEKAVLLLLVLLAAFNLRKLQKAGVALASGAFGYQVDTEGMIGDFKRHGENLNRIGDGMARAVEMRMKSERMKTELITNVSHDIKTPLTSIINYADLIGRESCENVKITEYAQVLVRQSVRLKRLIEDLVEASKAATGNLEVNLLPCDAAIFISQTAGEYEQKLREANLELVAKQPETPVKVMADGRRMLRVFDNLMNNIYKYAQPGTRVYLTLETIGEEAVITFKNISREALNISAEELVERFVRGDSARNTEGNGLGLSIAKSLTELQRGTMALEVDGDLFKAILRFPILKEEGESKEEISKSS